MSALYWHGGRTVAVAVTGPKFLRCLAIEADGLHVLKLKRTDERQLTPLTYHGKPYPTGRAMRHYRKLARYPGTTKAARKLLRRWYES